MTYKHSPVSLTCFSTLQNTTVLVEVVYYFTTELPFCNSMERCGFVISQIDVKSPYTAHKTCTEQLFRAGIIYNATECSISSSEISILPELHGTTRTRLDTPSFYLPDQPSVLAIHEAPQIEEAAPTKVMELNNIMSCLASPQRSLEVDMLFHICQTSLH